MAKLDDYDIWYKPCDNCGYDTAKASKRSRPRCWKCGRGIYRDFSDRALKAKSTTKEEYGATNGMDKN